MELDVHKSTADVKVVNMTLWFVSFLLIFIDPFLFLFFFSSFVHRLLHSSLHQLIAWGMGTGSEKVGERQ